MRGSERAKFINKFTRARLPGQCADIWEKRADIWAARGFLGLKSHLIIKPSSKFAYICQGMSAHVFYGGVMIPKEDYNHNLMQEIDGGMMGVLLA